MKTEMRQQLAQLPFEEKIRKVGDLIRLAREFQAQRVREEGLPKNSRPAARNEDIREAATDSH